MGTRGGETQDTERQSLSLLPPPERCVFISGWLSGGVVARGSGEPDGTGRGSGEPDGIGRGTGEPDGASRGSGEPDGASRGSGEL